MLSTIGAHRVIEALRVELFRRKVTQERISTATGMSQSKVSRRLNGNVSPTLDELESIAAAAGLHVDISLTAAEPEAADQ